MKSMKRHFLQSPAWAEFEKAEGREVFLEKGEGFEYLAVKYQTPLGCYLYCPYGPVVSEGAEAAKATEEGVKATDEAAKATDKDVKVVGAMKAALDSLVKLAREQKALFIRVEPTVAMSAEEMRKLGLKKSHDLDPAHTWVLDLTQSKDDIMAGIEKRKLRHWRTCGNKGITLRKTQNPEQITVLTDFLKKLGERDHFNPQDEAHLKRQLEAGFATLYIAEVEDKPDADSEKAEAEAGGGADGEKAEAGEIRAGGLGNGPKKVPIAAALIYDYDGVRYYAHAATDEEHRKLMAGTIILIQMIMDAKDEGAKVFDFWGITTSEDPKHPWYGFTQYKKSFGGRQVDYAGTWDLPVSKMKYRLYGMMRKINRALRKSK